MIKRYEKFLKLLDKKLEKYFSAQTAYIKCKKGCTQCCEIGEYPFSRLEAEYLMKGYLTLSPDLQNQVRNNINALKSYKKSLYRCPFLINNECAVYEFRGITCRTHGLAYFDGEKINLPYCANNGLNYAEVFDTETGEVTLENPIKEDLRIDKLLRNTEAEEFELECGEIRPLIDWFK